MTQPIVDTARLRDAGGVHGALVFQPRQQAAGDSTSPNGPLNDRRCAENCDCIEPNETRAAGIAGYYAGS